MEIKCQREKQVPLSNENVEIAEDLRKGRIGLIGGVQLGGYDENGKGNVRFRLKQNNTMYKNN